MRRRMARPGAVARSARSTRAASSRPSRSRRPMTDRRTPCFTQRSASRSSPSCSRPMRAATSSRGRCQLSAEKANRVRVPMPRARAAETRRRMASTPAAWPALRGRPRDSAQRPLPSMMMATWSPEGAGVGVVPGMAERLPDGGVMGSTLARGPDDGLHVIEIALERAPARLGEAVLGARHAPGEGFLARDVAGVLQLARVHAQVAVRGLHEPLELDEAELVGDRERAHDAETDALVDEAVEAG